MAGLNLPGSVILRQGSPEECFSLDLSLKAGMALNDPQLPLKEITRRERNDGKSQQRSFRICSAGSAPARDPTGIHVSNVPLGPCRETVERPDLQNTA